MKNSIHCIALLAALACTPAGARVIDSSAGGFTIENVVTVPVDAATAWKALVEDVDHWWPKGHSWWGKEGKFSIEPRAGGCFCETAGARSAMHMTVAFVDPGKMLRMVGGLGPLQGMGLNGAMDWRLDPTEGGTKITLHYVAGGYTTQDLAKFVAVVDQVQGIQLGGLAQFLSPPAPGKP
ncbi:MAG TPA: SRPBCC domain-containing protein [Solimonas sp.]|nr:SRPBCC domain-containing protein [Solimonas sp.]